MVLFIMPLLMVMVTAVSAEAATWSFQFSGGSAYNFKTPVRIDQEGAEVINADAVYSTRPFTDSPYFMVRAGWRKGRNLWDLELLHHKIFLKNPPPEVAHFEISHGMNLLTVNRAWFAAGLIYRVGFGIVIAYPDSITVRGRTQDGPYAVTGPTAQAALEKRFYFGRNLFASLEAKLTSSYAHIKIAGGDADVTNVAIHGLFGMGLEF